MREGLVPVLRHHFTFGAGLTDRFKLGMNLHIGGYLDGIIKKPVLGMDVIATGYVWRGMYLRGGFGLITACRSHAAASRPSRVTAARSGSATSGPSRRPPASASAPTSTSACSPTARSAARYSSASTFTSTNMCACPFGQAHTLTRGGDGRGTRAPRARGSRAR